MRWTKGGGGRTFSSRNHALYRLADPGVYRSASGHLFPIISSIRPKEISVQIATDGLSQPVFLGIYLLGVLVVAIHVRHVTPSLERLSRRLGPTIAEYMPFIQKWSLVFAVIVALGFGSLLFVILAMQ